MMDIAEAIDGEAVSITRIRRSAGAYNADGEFVPGAADALSILAALQPARGRQLMDMPEGLRAEAGYLLWSRSDLALDDEIVASGARYRVLFVWPRPDGGFYRAAMGLVT